MKRILTADDVEAAFAVGLTLLEAPRSSTVITPAAWSKAHELGVTLDQRASTLPADAAADAVGSCERLVDPCGLIVVRGDSVRLGRFTGAGPDRRIGLTDLIQSGDGSPMAAGIMSWKREDSFPWSLDYDEVDLVLEGVLHIGIDGRTLEGRAGDVIYIPKGSRIVFGTPGHVRVFYVTYPADWAAAGQPRRPQS